MGTTWTLTLGPNIKVIDTLENETDLGNLLTTLSFSQPQGVPQLNANAALDGNILVDIQNAKISDYTGQTTLDGVLKDLISRTTPDVATLTTSEGNGVLQFSDKTFQRMILFTPTENATLTLAGGTQNTYKELYLLITMPNVNTSFTINLPDNCVYPAGGAPPIATGAGAQTLIKFGAIGTQTYLGGL